MPALIMRMHFNFVVLIFVACIDSEHIFTMEISRFIACSYTVIAGIFHQENIFATCFHWRKFYPRMFSSCTCINDCMVDIVTSTALAKIKSGEIFMQYTSANFGENFLP